MSTPRSNVSVNLRVRSPHAGRKVSHDGPDHLTIRAYASSLNCVVINLVENAIRYGGGGLVRLVVAPDSAVIAVEDEGPGIPDGRKEAMIEPFVCGDAARGMEGGPVSALGYHSMRIAAFMGIADPVDRKPRSIARIELPTRHIQTPSRRPSTSGPAEIYVYDNNSKDRTAAVAREAGAEVRSERRQGKGHVVRRMFADVDADIYVLVDGDATYDAAERPRMIEMLVNDRLDMVVGLRVDQVRSAYRPGHRTGNWMLTNFLSSVFGQAFKDILSGYRVFSRRFVKSFPVLSDGFEIETELTVHALELALPVAEVETPYYARPEGSFSKLNTWRDGFRILGTILKLYRSEKPLRFFSAIGVFLALVSIGLAIPILITYLEQGIVPRLPTAVLSMGLMIVAMLSVSSGLVLDTVTRGRREMKLLAYLSQPPVSGT